MRIDILSAVPEQLNSPLETSIIKRARDKGIVEIHAHDIRDWSANKHKTIDDTPYGGGAGMVLQVPPIAAAIRELSTQRKYDEIIFLTPEGETLNQGIANELSLKGNLLMLCGHYKGVDQRVRDMFITREISIGDYVLSGGELAALVLTDSIVRLLPGAIGDETSALSDSFQGNLLEPPLYTRPADFEGHQVPRVLLSGNHSEIEAWRDEQAWLKTKKLRPDLLDELQQ